MEVGRGGHVFPLSFFLRTPGSSGQDREIEVEDRHPPQLRGETGPHLLSISTASKHFSLRKRRVVLFNSKCTLKSNLELQKKNTKTQ